MRYSVEQTASDLLDELITDPGEDCIIWPLDVDDRYGYGRLRVPGKGMRHAHREALIRHTGIEGLFACHGPCNNRACINPNHLSWGTGRSNAADRKRDGTNPRGERHGSAKLTPDDVREIRSSVGVSQYKLAARFGVEQTTISSIQRRASWAWLDQEV